MVSHKTEVKQSDTVQGVALDHWSTFRLGTLCDKIGSGATPKGGSQVYVNEGVSLIRSQNVYNSVFKYDGLSHITDEAAYKLRSVTVQQDDVLLNITGDSVARCTVVPAKVLPARVNQHVAIVRVKQDVCSPQFLQAVLTEPKMQAYMIGLASSQGGSRNALTKSNIEEFEIVLPPLLVQRKIASILGAYDDLIENNRRRIALLEKMARELYREYFVRRSGNSQTSFSLNQIAKFVRGRVIVKDATKPGDVPVVAGGLEPAYYHDTANTEAPVVTVSGSGANAGFARMYFEKVWASDCSWVDATTTKYIRFVYCFLKDKDAELRNAQKGAAQPHVHAKDVNALVVTADEERIAAFENIVTPLFDELANLTFQNRNLARQRDRLLPRLMSGKIDLEKFVQGEEVDNG